MIELINSVYLTEQGQWTRDKESIDNYGERILVV